MAEEARLESVYTSKAYREFESRSLRKAAHLNQHDLDAPLFPCRYRPAKLQPTATKQTYSTTRQGFSPPVCARSPEPIGGVRLQSGGVKIRQPSEMNRHSSGFNLRATAVEIASSYEFEPPRRKRHSPYLLTHTGKEKTLTEK